MFVEAGEYSLFSYGIDQYVRRFENDYYFLFIILHTKNGVLQELTNVADKKQLHIEFVAKNKIDYPAIYASIRKDGAGDIDDVLIGIPFTRVVNFFEMKNETGVWRLAAETVIDANKLIETEYPGYYITKQTEY